MFYLVENSGNNNLKKKGKGSSVCSQVIGAPIGIPIVEPGLAIGAVPIPIGAVPIPVGAVPIPVGAVPVANVQPVGVILQGSIPISFGGPTIWFS